MEIYDRFGGIPEFDFIESLVENIRFGVRGGLERAIEIIDNKVRVSIDDSDIRGFLWEIGRNHHVEVDFTDFASDFDF